ncbi:MULTISPECIES: STAS domain-containing protein [unclassified Streptomyces]|uniref:STAS domain-containing protein n=1 Tax=unclassified Streptomyces TaxID=2593676 RepID=UPI002258261C|nr:MULTISPECIES: STAS domain-containing protein [unclassified Streptomyces]MCX4625186.1 STAS domain-containing protein [Streptomyces sp. NBC_01443]MCX4633551.1 STAS domain-containing protein [Streptomyces sp. NBC_01443]WSW48807.1 STAS domain-containing protein [Streptomyces sp. NBC_01001]
MAEHPPREAGGNDVAVDVLKHTVAVRPVGEIDIETAPSLRLALTEALAHASSAKPVVVDCSRLTFCDSSALNALLTARRTAQETDTVIRLAAPNHQLQRLLEMTGALPLFPVDAAPPTDGRIPMGYPDGLQ